MGLSPCSLRTPAPALVLLHVAAPGVRSPLTPSSICTFQCLPFSHLTMAALSRTLKYTTAFSAVAGASCVLYEQYMGGRYAVHASPAHGSSVLVVGGGIAGVSSAYFLAKQGYAVTVLDQAPDLGPGAVSASACNAGWHRPQQHSPLTSPKYVWLALTSLPRPEGSSALCVCPQYFLMDPEWLRFGVRFLTASLSGSLRRATSAVNLELSQFSAEMLHRVAQEEGIRDDEWDREDIGWHNVCLDNPELVSTLAEGADQARAEGFPSTVHESSEAQSLCSGSGYSKRVQVVHRPPALALLSSGGGVRLK